MFQHMNFFHNIDNNVSIVSAIYLSYIQTCSLKDHIIISSNIYLENMLI